MLDQLTMLALTPYATIVGIFVLVLMLVMLYFLPAFVAWNRGHYNTLAIFILNVFLGWSFIAWVIALVWAFTSTKQVKEIECLKEEVNTLEDAIITLIGEQCKKDEKSS